MYSTKAVSTPDDYERIYDIVGNTLDRETELGYPNYGFTQAGATQYANTAEGRNQAINAGIDQYFNKYGLYEMPDSQQAMAFDFAFNSEDPRASMMVAAGKLTPAEKLQMYSQGKLDPAKVDEAWERYGADVMAMGDALNDPFAAEKTRSYSNTTGARTKLPEWTNRVNEVKAFAPKYFSNNQPNSLYKSVPVPTGIPSTTTSGNTSTATTQPLVIQPNTASQTAPGTDVPSNLTEIALGNFNRPRPQVSATPTGSEEDKTETGSEEDKTKTGPGKDERYIPWRSNYAPIVAGGLAASAAPLANIITSFTAEDTRAAAPVKFERPGYEPVALARQAGNQALGTYRSALRSASPTAGAYLSNLAVTAPSMGVNVGKQVAEQRANIDTRRAQIQGQEQMYNDRIRQFNILNQARDEAARNQLRMQGAAGLGEIGQGVITDVGKTRGQEEILRALETKDFSPFKFERDARGRWRQVLSPRGAEYYMNSKGTNKVVTDSEGNRYEILPNGTIRKMQ
jgi:hypothetical protein